MIGESASLALAITCTPETVTGDPNYCGILSRSSSAGCDLPSGASGQYDELSRTFSITTIDSVDTGMNACTFEVRHMDFNYYAINNDAYHFTIDVGACVPVLDLVEEITPLTEYLIGDPQVTIAAPVIDVSPTCAQAPENKSLIIRDKST